MVKSMKKSSSRASIDRLTPADIILFLFSSCLVSIILFFSSGGGQYRFAFQFIADSHHVDLILYRELFVKMHKHRGLGLERSELGNLTFETGQWKFNTVDVIFMI